MSAKERKLQRLMIDARKHCTQGMKLIEQMELPQSLAPGHAPVFARSALVCFKNARDFLLELQAELDKGKEQA